MNSPQGMALVTSRLLHRFQSSNHIKPPLQGPSCAEPTIRKTIAISESMN